MVVLVLLVLMLVTAPAAQAAPTLVPLGPTFSQPTYATAPPSEPGRVFVTERAGVIRVVEGSAARTFLDLTAITRSSESERGLLSIAFAPDYADSGLFYAYLTARDPVGEIQVWEFRRSAADPGVADPTSGRLVLAIPHPDDWNHNGGQLQFGPDGRLWLATGDGGGSDNRYGHAQDPSSPLGKLLRLDPRSSRSPRTAAGNASGTTGTTAAADANTADRTGTAAADADTADRTGTATADANTADRTGTAAAADADTADRTDTATADADTADRTGTATAEVVARGLRNPWRFSFAPDGRIVIADVGQSRFEEINVGLADNYGWPCREGVPPYLSDPGCTGVPLADPVLQQPHSAGFCAIVGGYVVRDPGLPTLLGRYVYGDNCNVNLRSLDLDAPASDAAIGLSVPVVSSFGEDACGRVLVVSLAGTVSRLVDGTPSTCPATTPTPTPTPEPTATATPTPDPTATPAAAPAPDATVTAVPPAVRDMPASTGVAGAPDTRACSIRVRVSGARQLTRRRYLTVALRSDEACRATLTAAHFRTATVRLRPGVNAKVRLRQKRPAKLRRVVIRVRSVDAAGNVKRTTHRVRIPR